MGKLICSALEANSGTGLSAILEAPGHGDEGREFKGARVYTSPREAVSISDAVIDFSSPPATLKLLEQVKESRTALVIGTTGFNEEQKIKIKDAASKTPILLSPNMSIGVNILFKAAAMINRALEGSGYHKEIVEAHHSRKVDSPSGTAEKILSIIKNEGDIPVYGREGAPGPRKDNEIGVHAIRGGGIAGEHTLMWIGQEDRIEISHRASSRRIFAQGAVRAAIWLSSAPAGPLYGMEEVLG